MNNPSCVDHSCAYCNDCEDYMEACASNTKHYCTNPSLKGTSMSDPYRTPEKPKLAPGKFKKISAYQNGIVALDENGNVWHAKAAHFSHAYPYQPWVLAVPPEGEQEPKHIPEPPISLPDPI